MSRDNLTRHNEGRLGTMRGFRIGQRVTLAEASSVSSTVSSLHADDRATVLRCELRQGEEHYLVQFDRADVGLGLYWLPLSQLMEECI